VVVLVVPIMIRPTAQLVELVVLVAAAVSVERAVLVIHLQQVHLKVVLVVVLPQPVLGVLEEVVELQQLEELAVPQMLVMVVPVQQMIIEQDQM
jgi:hypothetical protein